MRWQARTGFLAVRVRAAEMLRGRREPRDGRRGFGIVCAHGPISRCRVTLHYWGFRYSNAWDLPASLDAKHFIDDPFGALPGHSLGRRLVVAEAFVEAANGLMGGADVGFTAHPLEVVPAGGDLPPGLHRRGARDVLSIDLMSQLEPSKVIDALVEEHYGRVVSGLTLGGVDALYGEMWHRIARLNAARAMLSPGCKAVGFPGISAFRRRYVRLEG